MTVHIESAACPLCCKQPYIWRERREPVGGTLISYKLHHKRGCFLTPHHKFTDKTMEKWTALIEWINIGMRDLNQDSVMPL